MDGLSRWTYTKFQLRLRTTNVIRIQIQVINSSDAEVNINNIQTFLELCTIDKPEWF